VHVLIQKVKKRANPQLNIIGHIINRYDGRRRIEQDFRTMIEKHLGKIVGLDNLPCIVKEVDGKKRFLLQFVANLQREDISPIEEAAGIKYLVERYGYTQARVAKLLNKSKSYVSQIFGLERLSETAKEKVQTSELPKEVQIRASREKDPEKQMEILNKASEDGKTVRQIRQEQKESQLSKAEKVPTIPNSDEEPDKSVIMINKFSKWSWQSDDGRFEINIKFNRKHSENKKVKLIRTSLEEVLTHVKDIKEVKS
jgi:ParB family chromosome partitioning protein